MCLYADFIRARENLKQIQLKSEIKDDKDGDKNQKKKIILVHLNLISNSIISGQSALQWINQLKIFPGTFKQVETLMDFMQTK